MQFNTSIMKLKIIMIALSLLCLNVNLLAQCHIDDWTALKALYESTDGDEWEEKEGWEQIKGDTLPQDCDLSKMKGINLDEDYQTRVEELLLPGNNLTGILPNEISNLKKLKKIILFNNKLTGTIPNSIGELNNLVTLDIAFNLLTGSIPPEIGNLKELIWLELFSNQLSGEIPPELGNLESVLRIDLSENKLTGEIPIELSNLSIGVFLILNNNQLSGSIPPVFSDFLFNNFRFTLYNNNLSGCFDASLTKLCDHFKEAIYGFWDTISEGNNFDATWEEFCFEGKGICDTTNRCHPADWQALQTIYQNYDGSNWQNTTGWDSLIVNQDTIPANCNLDELYGVSTNAAGRVDSIDLSGNELSGDFGADWANLDSLTYLNIANNNLSGCFDTLSRSLCGQLSSAYFNGESNIDEGNNFATSWQAFCEIGICDTTNRCHPQDWQALQTIYENYNGSNWQNTSGWDSLIVNQASMPDNCNLDELYGVSTNAAGRLDSIDLSGNQLSGGFGAEWLNLSELSYLNIANNNLTGCFDSLAVELCDQLNSPYFVADSLIDLGNDFDGSWEFFCATAVCDTMSVDIFDPSFVETINLFPNPASDFVFVDVPKRASKASYKIFNLQGKLVNKGLLSYHKKIDIEQLPVGTYFIKMVDRERKYLAKLVKW